MRKWRIVHHNQEPAGLVVGRDVTEVAGLGEHSGDLVGVAHLHPDKLEELDLVSHDNRDERLALAKA